MYKLYITGDSRLDPVNSFNIVYKMAGKLLKRSMERGIPLSEVQFLTGNTAMGIERAVRYLYADVTPLLVIQYPIGPDGEPDYLKGLGALDVDHVIILDEDPLASPIAKAAVTLFGDEKVHFALEQVLAD